VLKPVPYDNLANMSSPRRPYRLVTVNSAPERAKLLVSRVIEELKAQDTIVHVANAESEYTQRDSLLSSEN
jgi:hypothetical protein